MSKGRNGDTDGRGGGPAGDPVVAAGAVVWREAVAGRFEICLVHRPKYDDWSLPKGKRHDGEHILACAVREVAEETGHTVALGLPLPPQRYQVDGRPKVVHYWAAKATDPPPDRRPDDEVDEVTFLPAAEAIERLTHVRDAELVESLVSGPVRTTPLALVRHAKAVSRTSWEGTDVERPLDARGHAQADGLVAPLAALGILRAISSDAVRCVDTLRPWATAHEMTLELEPLISEEGFAAAGRDAAQRIVRTVVPGPATVVCSHRPVLPALLAAVGAAAESPPMRPGNLTVVHHRSGVPVAIEHHVT